MNREEYKGVYVYAQQVDNKVSNIALELLGKAKVLADDLGSEVVAMLLGSDIKDQAQKLAEYGADKVIYAHCHGEARFRDSILGVRRGVRYSLVSGDFLKWRPALILP